MAKLTQAEQLELLRQKKAKILEKEKKILSKLKQQERKERTKKLIKIGAGVEYALGYELNNEEVIQAFVNYLKQQEEKKWVSLGINKHLKIIREQQETDDSMNSVEVD